jgi:tetratricopeptide (TPR) repeat protein
VAEQAVIDGLVRDLGNESYAVRQAASAKLWNLGDRALPALREAAQDGDPEVAFRSRDILLKLDLGILPDTDPAVIRLIERYRNAPGSERIRLLEELMKLKAHRPLLRLFARETDAKVLDPWQRPVRSLALRTARESLLADDPAGAREVLGLFAKDEALVLALAAFHRGQGTLEAEIERLAQAGDAADAAWRLALLRAAGDAAKAYDAAVAAGKPEVAGAMAMLRGDPLPWLRFGPAAGGIAERLDLYTPLAIKRWEGKPLDKDDFAAIAKRLTVRAPGDRILAAIAAILLGEPAMAEPALAKSQPWAVFKTMDMTERVDEALRLLDLDPAKPDYDTWVAERFKRLEKEDESDGAPLDLVWMAEFLETRGLMAEQEAAFDARLVRLAERDEGMFTSILGSMCERPGGVVGPVLRVGAAWAGGDDRRWEELLVAIFGDNEDIMPAWSFLGEVNPKADRKERFAGLLALCNLGPDPSGRYTRWLDACWQHIAALDAARREQPLLRMEYLLGLGGDVTNRLKLADMRPNEKLAPQDPDDGDVGDDEDELLDDDVIFVGEGEFIDDGAAGRLADKLLLLSAADRWQDAAALALGLLNRKGVESRSRPDLHAYAAACLRRAGREEEAARHDQWVERLALGEAAIYQRIALGYAFGADYNRSARWWRRAVCETDPGSSLFGAVLFGHLTELLDSGAWSEAAAAAEVMAQITSQGRYAGGAGSASALLQVRQQADLARALSLLPTDRARAVAMLDRSHALVPCDGSLADHFFPAVRKAGLVKEHDRWFAASWQVATAAVERFPRATSTRNTAAWLASRAGRQLDAAETLLTEALREHPRQAAYLDTMAELRFAKGDREGALKWSAQSVNQMPTDSTIRRQYHRFATAPLPEDGRP